ncbi:hypothetical protein [Promicromonospora sp. MEB111]|uniref:hypothetical protein n=1 Tax=Promicromonospora sp. MEB111 TaxID=3040301 RepID=UPI00254CCF0B|nr:hypothetical protein [Promicromonospora sp. MEB111]
MTAPPGADGPSFEGIRAAIAADPDLFALLPMDFYYPGKGATGDLAPRKDFAPRWHGPLVDALDREKAMKETFA